MQTVVQPHITILYYNILHITLYYTYIGTLYTQYYNVCINLSVLYTHLYITSLAVYVLRYGTMGFPS